MATVTAAGLHSPRRAPAPPAQPIDLPRGAAELLEQARSLSSGRSGRTLTPGAGAALKQTLLALVAGSRLQDHVAPGPTTLQVVAGRVVLRHAGQAILLEEGTWADCPRGTHGIEAVGDAVLLITVAPSPDRVRAA